MQKRHVVLSGILLGVIIASFSGAFYLWKERARDAAPLARVPAIPDLSRRPEELQRRLQAATRAALRPGDGAASWPELAKLYFANGFVSEATQLLEILREREPGHALWPYLLADLRRRAGDSADEEKFLRATLALDESYPAAWLRLAETIVKRNGPPAEARAAYEKALALQPGSLRAQYAVISHDARHGAQRDLRRELTALVQAHPQIKQMHELLAELHHAAGDTAKEAQERHLARVANRELENTDPWIDALAPYCFDAGRLGLMAIAAYRERRLPAAEALLKQAISLAPADATLRDSLSHVYELLGRPADALAVLDQAVKDNPDDPLMRARLARLLSLQQRGAEAIASLRTALERWPADAGLHAALGFTLREAGRNAEALPEFREAVRLEPTFVEAHYNLGFCLLSIGQRDAARTSVEKALAMRPDYLEALLFLGSLALEAKDVAAAEPHVNRLYALQPTDAGARLLYATLHLLKGGAANDAGNLAEAGKNFRLGLEASPDFPPLLREAGLLAIRQQRYADAALVFERYVHAEPNDAEGYVLYGKTLLATQRDAEARDVFQRGINVAAKTGATDQLPELQRMLQRR